MASITNFQGIMTDAEPQDLPAGASQDQKNVTTTSPGKLQVRKGIQPITFASSSTISAAAYNTFQRMCFCKTRFGELIGVNGLERGFRWDGKSALVEDLGMDQPSAAPTATTPVLNPVINNVASGAGSVYQITTASAHGLSGGESVTIYGVVGTGTMQADLNGQTFTVTLVNTTNFSLDGTTFAGTYTQDGVWVEDGQGATTGTYVLGYRYLDDTSTPVYSSLSAVVTVTATAGDEFSWANILASAQVRSTQIELWRSTAGVTNVLFKIATLTDTGSTQTYTTDTADDDTLNASSDDDTLLILRDPPTDTALVARRFVPPPTTTPYVVMFQDRHWYGGRVKYTRGTVETAGSTTLTGTSTDWTTDMAGRYVDIDGETEPLLISSVGGATSITLATAAATTASGKSYTIYPDPSTRRKLYYSEPDEPESVPTINTVTIQENTGDDDEVAGLMPHGSFLYVLTDRHKYNLSFVRQPNIDAAVRYVDDRGVFNQWCWDYFENTAFLMDDQGPYVFDGQNSQPIGGPIQDLWRKDGDGDSIDFTKSDKFHIRVDRPKERVMFFVSFTGDSDDLPTRCLVFNIRRATWDPYEYPQQIGAAATTRVSGENRLILGGESEAVHLADEASADVVSAIITGTATSSSSTTLTDTGASFTSAVVGALVYIYEGTGKGQSRKVTAQTSTQLTVAAWTTNPDTTSKYAVGAIEWNWRTKEFSFPRDGSTEIREVGMFFKPTTADVRIDARLYYNQDSSPRDFEVVENIGDAVEIKDDELADVVFFLESARSDLQNSVGREQFRFDGQASSEFYGDVNVSVELRGHGGTETVEVNALEIQGVED